METALRGHEETKAELEEMMTKHALLITSTENSASQLISSEAQISSLQSTIASLTAQLSETSTLLTTTKEEADELTARLAESESERSSLTEENKRLMEGLDELRGKVVQLTAEKLALSEDLERSESARRKSTTRITQLETSLASYDSTRELIGQLPNAAEVRDMLKEREEKLVLLERMLEERRKEDSEIRGLLEGWEEKIERLNLKNGNGEAVVNGI